jgi:hypothetical protein
MALLKKIWNDPVWSKVIAAAVLAVAGWSAHHRWPALRLILSKAWSFLLATSPVQHWVLGLLIIAAVIIIVVFVGLLLCIALPQSDHCGNLIPISTRPEWLSYTNDSFFGLKWRWHYGDGEIQRLLPFSPHCDYQIFPDNASPFTSRVDFYCDSCRRDLGTLPESWGSLESKVTRFIQQKLRSGKWASTSGSLASS